MLAITKQAEIRMLEFLEKRDIPMTQCFRLSGPPQGAKLSIDSYSDEDRVFHRNDRCTPISAGPNSMTISRVQL